MARRLDRNPSAGRRFMAMAVSFSSTSRWVSALAICGSLMAATEPKASKKASTPKADVAYNIPLWEEGKVPLAAGNGPLDVPFLTVFLPAENKRNGTSVVVAPGGGNIMLMYGVEGIDIAERFNDWGAAAFVLHYRLSPKDRENSRVLA